MYIIKLAFLTGYQHVLIFLTSLQTGGNFDIYWDWSSVYLGEPLTKLALSSLTTLQNIARHTIAQF